jgi:hypothetical protein
MTSSSQFSMFTKAISTYLCDRSKVSSRFPQRYS